MSSWKRKMRVKWNRNLDGLGNNSEGVFERQGSLRKPKEIHKEEPFKRSWSFRLGSNKDSKESSPTGQTEKDAEKHNVLMRLFRFKDKKRGSFSEGKASEDNRRSTLPSGLPVPRRRMSDVTAFVEEKEKRNLNCDLSQWASVPVDVNGAVPPVQEPQPELSQWGSVPAGMVAGNGGGTVRPQTLPRGLLGVRSSPMLVDVNGRAGVESVERGSVSCVPQAAQLPANESTEYKVADGSDESTKLPRPNFLALGKSKDDNSTEACCKKLVVNGEHSNERSSNDQEIYDNVLTDDATRTEDRTNGNADEKNTEYEKVFAKAVVPHFIPCDNERKRIEDDNGNIKALRLNGNLLKDQFQDIVREKVLVNGTDKPQVSVQLAQTSPNGIHGDVSSAYDIRKETDPTAGLEGGSPDAQNKTPRILAASPTVRDNEARINAVGETSSEGEHTEFDELEGYEEDSVFDTVQLDDDMGAVNLNRTYVLKPDESVELLNDIEESLIEELKNAGGCLGSDEQSFCPELMEREERIERLATVVSEDCCPGNVTSIFVDSAGPVSQSDDPREAGTSQDHAFVTCVEVEPPVQAPIMNTTGEELVKQFEAEEENAGTVADGLCSKEEEFSAPRPLQQLCCSKEIVAKNDSDEQSSSTESGSSSRSGSVPTEIEVRRGDSSSPDISDSAPESPKASRMIAACADQPTDHPTVERTDDADCRTEQETRLASDTKHDLATVSEPLFLQQPLTGSTEDSVPTPNEEASFREKLHFFDTISSPSKVPADSSKVSKASRIPMPSRLPRPSARAKPDTPAPPKHARVEKLAQKTVPKLENGDLIPTKEFPKVSKTDTTPSIGVRPDLKANERVTQPRTTKGLMNGPEIGAQQRHETPRVSRTDPKRASITAKKLPQKLASKLAESKIENKTAKPKVPPTNTENLVVVDKGPEDIQQTTAEEHRVDVLAPGCLVRSRTFVRDDDDEETSVVASEAATNHSPAAREEPAIANGENHDAGLQMIENHVSPEQKANDTTEETIANVDCDKVDEERQSERLETEGQDMRVETSVVNDAALVASSHEAKQVRDLVAAIMDSVQVPVVDSTSTVDEDYAGAGDTFHFKTPNSTLKASTPLGRAKAAGGTRVGHLTKAEFTKEIQRLGALCEARTKEANFLKLQLKHASAGFAAFGVLLRHLTEQHDVFSVPHLTDELLKSRQEIDRAQATIEQYQVDIEELKQKQLGDLEAMKEKMTQKHSAQLEELEAAHKSEISFYTESHAKKTEELKAFYSGIIEEDRKNRDSAIDTLKEKHKEKIDAINEEYSIQLDAINEEHAAAQAQLEAKHSALMDQYRALQEQAREFQSSVLLDTDTKIQWLSKKNADLQKEVESLNVVLEMRAEQIQALQRSKLEMERKEEELERCKDKIQKLEARNEDLQELLNEKVKIQSQLSVENAVLRENSERQNRQLSRLDMHNEELKFKLRESSNQSFVYERGSTKPRPTAPKRFSVADPTAMSRSWHSERTRMSGAATRKTLSFRSHQRSQTLPHNGEKLGHQADNRKVRRSMSDSVPAIDSVKTRLFSTDEEEDANAELQHHHCSHEELLRLTWVCSPEDGESFKESGRCKSSPNPATSSSSENGGSLSDQTFHDGLSDGSLSVEGASTTFVSPIPGEPSPQSLAGEAMIADEATPNRALTPVRNGST